MAVPMRQMPADSRPRERLYRLGPAALSDVELLALVIGSGRLGASALQVAAEVLAEFGSLTRLGEAKPEELERLASIGRTKAAALIATAEIGRRAAMRESAATISCAADLAAAVKPHISSLGREEAFIVALSTTNRIRKVERLGLGGQGTCGLEVREVLATALRVDAAAIGIVHTHPSGDPTPSAEDTAVTHILSSAANQVGLRFLDHVIVAGSRWCVVPPPAPPLLDTGRSEPAG
jgi:DNA repair protein RadC